ncbi:MAG: circularly permuted type 2 ATP-grasp protein, partial [Quadrisphaera sp.]
MARGGPPHPVDGRAGHRHRLRPRARGGRRLARPGGQPARPPAAPPSRWPPATCSTPWCPRSRAPRGLAAPAAYYERLRATLLAHARPGTRAALLSSGPGSGAWYEHQALASGAGLLLLGAGDLDVVGGRVLATSPHRGPSTSARSTCARRRPRRPRRRPPGAPSARCCSTRPPPAPSSWPTRPGNGVRRRQGRLPAPSPSSSATTLGERQLIEQVPTYLLADEGERRAALERIGELVTKPVDGHGGSGVMIGPAASAAEVVARRAEVAAAPQRWVAQELVQLSSLPSLAGGELVPRHVDLRVFAHVVGDGRDDARVARRRADPRGPRGRPGGQLLPRGGAKD